MTLVSLISVGLYDIFISVGLVDQLVTSMICLGLIDEAVSLV